MVSPLVVILLPPYFFRLLQVAGFGLLSLFKVKLPLFSNVAVANRPIALIAIPVVPLLCHKISVCSGWYPSETAAEPFCFCRRATPNLDKIILETFLGIVMTFLGRVAQGYRQARYVLEPSRREPSDCDMFDITLGGARTRTLV